MSIGVHDLKTDPAVFQLSLDGLKDWEIRFNDRNFQVGDHVLLRETKFSGEEMKAGKPLEFTGRTLHRVITSIVDGYGLENGWVILSLNALGGDWYCSNCGYLADSRVAHDETCDECHTPVEFHCVGQSSALTKAQEELTEVERIRQQDQAKIAELEKINSQLLQQAEGHAQEARTQKSIVFGIYQELGIQLGGWNGKSPVVAKFDELNRQLEAVRQANEDLAERCKDNDELKAQVNHLRSEFDFYADETNYEFGDVPGHIYAMDDSGSGARKALEQTPQQCLAAVKAEAFDTAAERCKGNHPKWGRTHIFLNEEGDRIREEAANAG